VPIQAGAVALAVVAGAEAPLLPLVAARCGVGWGGVASVDSEDFAHFGSESEVGREFDIEDGTRITNLIPRAAKQAEFCHFNSAQFRRAKQALCY
jgi:hypothetical protein